MKAGLLILGLILATYVCLISGHGTFIVGTYNGAGCGATLVGVNSAVFTLVKVGKCTPSALGGYTLINYAPSPSLDLLYYVGCDSNCTFASCSYNNSVAEDTCTKAQTSSYSGAYVKIWEATHAHIYLTTFTDSLCSPVNQVNFYNISSGKCLNDTQAPGTFTGASDFGNGHYALGFQCADPLACDESCNGMKVDSIFSNIDCFPLTGTLFAKVVIAAGHTLVISSLLIIMSLLVFLFN